MRDFFIDQILKAYALGLFPMAICADAPEYHWIRPEKRGVIFIDKFHIPKSMKKFMANSSYKVTKNKAFYHVLSGCREICENRKGTWINRDIMDMFKRLHQAGYAHSYECWDDKGKLVGGLYGLNMGRIFSGESMFHLQDNVSKLALLKTVYWLKGLGMDWMDVQMVTPLLKAFGASYVKKLDYFKLLRATQKKNVQFKPLVFSHQIEET